jgi:hypothetical protein
LALERLEQGEELTQEVIVDKKKEKKVNLTYFASYLILPF